MRDPNRIYKFCLTFGEVWAVKAPDLRFGQFIELIFKKIKDSGKDPFYLEEDEMMAEIKKIVDYKTAIWQRLSAAFYVPVAQSVEHLPFKQRVRGSYPLRDTTSISGSRQECSLG